MAESTPFLWTGNHPATDLCNTESVIGGVRVDLLPDFDAVWAWASLAGVASRGDPIDVTEREAARTLGFARRLRAALRSALDPTIAGPGAVDALNRVLGEAPGVVQAQPPSGRTGVALAGSTPAAQLRLDIAAATVDIFRHDRRRIRRCAGPTCVLLFLDISKSGRRRWCDMAVCGNAAKARRHHAKAKN